MALIESFRNIYTQKMKKNRNKRVESVESYFNSLNQNGEQCISFQGDSNNCLQYIISYITNHPQEEETVLNDIIDLLNDRFAQGEPHFISRLETDLSKEQLKASLDEIFLEEVQYGNFLFEKCICAIDDESNQVEINTRYEEYAPELEGGEYKRIVNSGDLGVTFDLNNQIFVVRKVGYSRVVASLIGYIVTSVPSIRIKQVYISKEARLIPNLLGSSFTALTLLAIYLIYSKLEKSNYIVNSVNSITFNNEKAPRVKSAKLGGADLFADPDVVERIYNGDKITKFVINVAKMEGDSATLVSDIQFDFRGVLKIVFFEPTGRCAQYLEDICADLLYCITDSINYSDLVAEATDIIRRHLTRKIFGSQGMLKQFVYEVKTELINALPEENESINKFFKKKFDV